MADYGASLQCDDTQVPREEVESRPADVLEKEDNILRFLFGEAIRLAPHMRESFIVDEKWWEKHSSNRAAHMFKFILLQAIAVTGTVFCPEEAPTPEECNARINEYNRRAKMVWKMEEEDFFQRQLECEAIGQKLLVAFDTMGARSHLAPVPSSFVIELDAAFRRHYKSRETYLLFGRTDDNSLEVQDAYAIDVAKSLETINSRYSARALLYLRKRYGRGAPLPLLSMASASAMWQACKSHYYRSQLATLHNWFEPFPTVLEKQGYTFVHSLHWFLRPKPNEEQDLFRNFYLSMMEWSDELYVVSLMEKYVAPEPHVADFVRRQLITQDDTDEITVALRHVTKGWRTLSTPYDTFVNYTCLDWQDQMLVDQVFEELPSAMFDLTLGIRVRSVLLIQYSELHNVRNWIQSFISAWTSEAKPRCTGAELWWDVVRSDVTTHSRWISTSLREHEDFDKVIWSWIQDSEYLQSSLQQYELSTILANNWGKEEGRVISEETAMQVIRFWESQGKLLDNRRRDEFGPKLVQSRDECEQLGLFRTRMPRFSQLFFYNFDQWEVERREGQSMAGGVVSKRGAEAYARSGARFESLCGISDIWYHYVESNLELFGGRNIQDIPVIPAPALHPRPNDKDMRELGRRFETEWFKVHSRPRPTRRIKTTVESSDFPTKDARKGTAPPNKPIQSIPFNPAAGVRGRVGVTTEEIGAKHALSSPVHSRVLASKEPVSGGTSADRLQRKENEKGETGGRLEEIDEGGNVQQLKQLVGVKGEANVEGVEEKRGEDGCDEFYFEEWPTGSSFDKALGSAMEELFQPESPPMERELGVSKRPDGLVRAANTAASDLQNQGDNHREAGDAMDLIEGQMSRVEVVGVEYSQLMNKQERGEERKRGNRGEPDDSYNETPRRWTKAEKEDALERLKKKRRERK